VSDSEASAESRVQWSIVSEGKLVEIGKSDHPAGNFVLNTRRKIRKHDPMTDPLLVSFHSCYLLNSDGRHNDFNTLENGQGTLYHRILSAVQGFSRLFHHSAPL
jgi:hypothetical protein